MESADRGTTKVYVSLCPRGVCNNGQGHGRALFFFHAFFGSCTSDVLLSFIPVLGKWGVRPPRGPTGARVLPKSDRLIRRPNRRPWWFGREKNLTGRLLQTAGEMCLRFSSAKSRTFDFWELCDDQQVWLVFKRHLDFVFVGLVPAVTFRWRKTEKFEK